MLYELKQGTMNPRNNLIIGAVENKMAVHCYLGCGEQNGCPLLFGLWRTKWLSTVIWAVENKMAVHGYLN
jgi:hypothetical protein